MNTRKGVTPDRQSAEFFDDLYASAPDPWGFADDAYERGRYRALVELLVDDVYERAFEPGCSIGELTVLLAERCHTLVATDVSATAVARARRRLRAHPHVRLEIARFPDGLPDAPLDLVVLSEVGYYLTSPRLREAIARTSARMPSGGHLVAVHWTGTSPDHLLTGQEVHELLDQEPSLHTAHRDVRPGYVLGRWVRR